MSDRTLPSDHTKPGVNRRTIVRTAAHTAWAAPVIIVATQAPSFAVSGPPLVTTAVAAAGGANRFRANNTFTNQNTTPTTGFSCTVVINAAAATGTFNGVNSNAVAGWTPISETFSSDMKTYTGVFSKDDGIIPGAATAAGPGADVLFPANPGFSGSKIGGIITTTPMPTPGSGVAGTATATA